MLEYMRKNANSSIVWLIIGAIALVFIFFGVGGGGGRSQFISVNGEDVNPAEFSDLVNQMNRSMAGEIGPEQEREIKLEAVSELVRRTLMRQFGKNMGLEPSDQAVAAMIASEETFQVDGRFNKEKYESLLKANRRDPIRYENQQRDALLMTGVSDLVSGLARVNNPEVMEKYHFQDDRAALEYAFFPSEGLKSGLTPTEDQLSDFYLRNQEQWRVKAAMKLDYVEIRPADFLDKVQVSDEELQEIYKNSEDRFTVEDSADVSHILFRFPNMNPGAEEKQAVLDKARAAYERARGEDFAVLAKEVSEDPTTAADGGALGEIGRGLNFPGFEEAIFSAPLNEVTEPVETSIGYHLIKVNKRQTAGLRPFEEVREVLSAERKAFKAHEAAVSQLEDLLIRAETNPNLAEAARSMSLEVKSTDMFTEDNPPAFFGGDEESLKKAFRSPLGRVASPVESEDYLVLFTPVERVDSAIPSLEQIRSEVSEAWVADEALRLVRIDALHFIGQAGGNWDEAVSALPAKTGIGTGKTELSARTSLMMTDPALSQVDRVEYLTSVFSMAKVGQVSPVPVAGRDQAGREGVFVLRLAAFEPVEKDQIPDMMMETFTSMVFMTKANLMYQVWREELVKGAAGSIKVPPVYVN